MAENTANAQHYSITFINNSTVPGTFMIFHQDENMSSQNIMSLAWLTKSAHPNTQVTIDWSTNYNFIWDETGTLIPGVTVDASQVVSADLNSANSIKLTHDQLGFSFSEPGTEAQPGNLLIQEDATIPPNTASVGIGMSGSGTFMVQAQPNMSLVFAPHTEYWVSFGNFTQGQVLDLEQMTNLVKVDFPPNIYHVKVTLNMDNTFTVS